MLREYPVHPIVTVLRGMDRQIGKSYLRRLRSLWWICDTEGTIPSKAESFSRNILLIMIWLVSKKLTRTISVISPREVVHRIDMKKE